jgi:hypothetical protein
MKNHAAKIRRDFLKLVNEKGQKRAVHRLFFTKPFNQLIINNLYFWIEALIGRKYKIIDYVRMDYKTNVKEV